MFRKSLAVGALALLVCLGGNKAFAQHNPDGFIQNTGWTFLFPLLNPFGAAPAVDVMDMNWVAPHDLITEDPRAGDTWDDIDFNGASPATGFDIGGLNDQPIWVTVDFLEGAFPGLVIDPTSIPLDFQGLVDTLNGSPDVPTDTIPGDNISSIAISYVENTTGDFLPVNVCTGSDDALKVFFNNVQVVRLSVARGYTACNETNFALLPPGVTKIVFQVWEGGGGHNLGLQIQLQDGTVCSDANADTTGVVFLGPGEPGDGLTGQPQFSSSRSVSGGELNCPAETIDVSITGEGPFDDAQAVTVVETLTVDNPTGEGITVSNVSNGGTVSESRLELAEGVNSSGFNGTLLVLGPIPQDGGAAPPDDALDAQYLGDDVDETDPAYRPAAGDTTNGPVMDNPAGDAINPGGVLTWNVVTGVAATFDYSTYYGGDVDNIVLYTGFYFCLPEDTDVYVGLGSDDSWMLRIDGEAIGRRSIGRGYGADNEIQDFVGPVSLAAGKHFLMMKVFEGGGGHGSRVGLFDADRNPLEGVSYDTDPAGDTCASPFVPVRETTTVTWETTIGQIKGDGVSYSVGLEGTGTVNISGIIVDTAAIVGPNSLPFPDTTGNIGIFDNGHLIGNATVGGLTFDGEVYTQTSNGVDIWTGGDDMYFAYKKVTGDFTATAHILDRQEPVSGSEWGKHGIMARQTCDVASKFVMIQTNLASEGQPVDIPRLASRNVHLDVGNMSEAFQAVDGAIPGFDPNASDYVKRRPEHMMMRRVGDQIYTYLAFDDGAGNPLRWAFLGSDDQPNRPAEQLVGMALTSHTANDGPTGTISYTFDIQQEAAPRENAIPGEEITRLEFESDDDLGITPAGTVTPPSIVDGRLRLTPAQNSQVAGQYYGVAASGDDGAPLLEEGFAAEFDVFFSKDDGSCLNSADGMDFVVIGTGEDDGLASAVAPQPQLEVDTLLGGGGGSMGYNGGGFTGNRAVNHQSFAVEFDDWNGGGDNEAGGSNQGTCIYHTGVNITGSTNSLQTNADFGVPTDTLPNIWSPDGVHAEIVYQPSGWVDVWVTANDGSVGRTHILSQQISPLPAGDVVIGWTAATGGANANHDVDNLVISTIEVCEEDPDSVSIDGCPADEVEQGGTVMLTASFSGANGAVTYSWAVTGGTIVAGGDSETVEIACPAEGGDVTATVTASDESCGDSVSASCSFTCAAPPAGSLMIPGDANLDGSLNVTDPVAMLNDLFGGIPVQPCLRPDGGDLTEQGLATLDWNGDGAYNINDPVGSLNYQFVGNAPAHALGADCVAIPGGDCADSCAQ